MKARLQLFVLLALSALGTLFFGLTGCLTPQQQEWTCQRAAEVVTAYQAAEAAGLVTDPKVIASAKVASAFLAGYCGWQTPVARSGPNLAPGPPATDRNGVLIVHPPPSP